MSSRNYTKLMKEFARVNSYAPKGKVPRNYNYDKYVEIPFRDPATESGSSASALYNIPLRQKSELYAASGALGRVAGLNDSNNNNSTSSNTSASLSSSSTTSSANTPPQPPSQHSDSATEYLQNIPLPTVLTRHIVLPSPSLANGTHLGKITGFRIEVTGRRGTRSATTRFGYGRLGTGNVGAAYVDFARSLLVNKKGATGVKVWIGYGR
ncbi:hypothetical protein PhCBS80983_g01895 [Powellomyces hirtus]|uniref:Ribosomal protein S3 C-terminal domain-containing protein n=1 Tax=Powellomyces hirtus TaxID=109895 RepID=A0A507E8J6_9FUNG|nr:hypothetical protein PhCBS80983_g01895 [Powellomyces hirtus]